jgi:hypothetical protein
MPNLYMYPIKVVSLERGKLFTSGIPLENIFSYRLKNKNETLMTDNFNSSSLQYH